MRRFSGRLVPVCPELSIYEIDVVRHNKISRVVGIDLFFRLMKEYLYFYASESILPIAN